MAKKHKKFQKTIKFLYISIAILFVFVFLFVYFNKEKVFSKPADLSIHFLEVGNKYTGDAIYIKAGNNDILIDAGSRKASATTICAYLDEHVKDKTLEYVIATHADQDHISGFVGSSTNPGIFDAYEIETLIDFPLTNKESVIYQEYVAKRDVLIQGNTKHYTALECYNNENGASRTIEISDGVEMTFLYNYFYEHKSTKENNYSVCILITQGNKDFLFTGDLEKEGEEKLVEYNALPEVDVYKAAHHGSKTSSNDCLLRVIKPKIVVFTCCAGSNEYTEKVTNQFPTQEVISRIIKYTDKLYVTSVAKTTEPYFESLNGTVVIISKKGQKIKVDCSNSNQILKDTKWFLENREWK